MFNTKVIYFLNYSQGKHIDYILRFYIKRLSMMIFTEPSIGLFCQIEFNAMCFIEQPESGDLTEYNNNCDVPGVEHLSNQCRGKL